MKVSKLKLTMLPTTLFFHVHSEFKAMLNCCLGLFFMADCKVCIKLYPCVGLPLLTIFCLRFVLWVCEKSRFLSDLSVASFTQGFMLFLRCVIVFMFLNFWILSFSLLFNVPIICLMRDSFIAVKFHHFELVVFDWILREILVQIVLLRHWVFGQWVIRLTF